MAFTIVLYDEKEVVDSLDPRPKTKYETVMKVSLLFRGKRSEFFR